MRASHYVIEEILRNWGNPEEVKEVFEKFAKRYSEDRELQEIYNEFQEHLKLSTEKMENIRTMIHRSRNIKKKNHEMKDKNHKERKDIDQLLVHPQPYGDYDKFLPDHTPDEFMDDVDEIIGYLEHQY